MRDLAAGELLPVAKHFRRIDTIQRLIKTQVDILETMTPHEFNAFRENLNPASGFQSVQFREIEFIAGLRNTEALKHMHMDEARRARLNARLAQPSLYDRVKEYLRGRGFVVGSHDGLIATFRTIYSESNDQYDLYLLLEELIEFDERFLLWPRAAHSDGRANDRREERDGRIAGSRLSRNHARESLLPGAVGSANVHGKGLLMAMQTATQAVLRDRFPILANSTYLVSHSMGAAPQDAKRALDLYFDEWAAEGPKAWERWLPRITAIADGIGSIVGAPAGSVFLAPNVSVLQAALATSLRFEAPRNEVVYEALQFPSLTYVWTEWQRFGALPRIVPSDDGRTVSTERIIGAITERTAIAVLSHAYYISGALCDVRAVQAHCRKTGTLLCVDAYQTTGIYPYDVTAWDLDIVTGGSHKWLCGSAGCGWIYVKPELRERFEPAVTGWMAHARPFAFEPAPMVWAPSMYRWGTGTPTIPGYMAAKPGHDVIREVGVPKIREHNLRLTTLIAELALERGLQVNTPLDPAKRTGWIAIDFSDSQRVYRALADRRIFVDYRPSCGIRVGPHFYTTDDEIGAFFEALDDLRKKPVG